MEVAVAVEFEDVRESTRCHFEDCVFHSSEFVLYLLVVFGGVIEGAEHFERSFFLAFQHKPIPLLVMVVAIE